MSLDLQKIRERVEEAVTVTSEVLVRREMQVSCYEHVSETTTRPVMYEQPVPVGEHADPLFRLLDSLHALNVLEREERDRFPIVYAEVPDRAAELELIEAAIAYRDIAMVSDRDIHGAGAHTVRFADAVRAYKKAVNQ